MAETHRMRFCFALLAAVSLASCGGSSKTAATTSRPASVASAPTSTPATSTAVSTPTSTTTATTVSTATPPPAPQPPPCVASGLALSFLGQQGATGHGEIGFALRNTGSKSCRTYGWPGVLFLDRSGHALPTNSTRTMHDLFGSTPAVNLVIEPGASVSFRLGVTHGINSSAGCTTAFGLQVIPPNDTATLRTTIPQGGAYECGTATVSPLRPQESAYP